MWLLLHARTHARLSRHTPIATCTHTRRARRHHSRALLVSFDSDNSASSHVDVLTREVQAGFKRLDGDIRAMGTAEAGGEDDAQVRACACVRVCVLGWAAVVAAILHAHYSLTQRT
jgi:hypothetical protein